MSVKNNLKTVVLGTGGTIAGLRKHADKPDIYNSGQLGITDIMSNAGVDLTLVEFKDVARIDSKNMGLPVWQDLYKAVAQAQQRSDVGAVLITHGTDTLEESAFLLHALGPWPKPVLMTCAMKPADHPQADGPGNLRDALFLSVEPGLSGVHVVFNRRAHHAMHVQKTSTDHLEAFSSGAAGVSAEKNGSAWTLKAPPVPVLTHDWPGTSWFLKQTQWPRVEWLSHHSGSTPDLIQALLQPLADAPQLRGLVVAGTGAGTVKPSWEAALQQAMAQGIQVWLTSRCTWGLALPQAQQSCGELIALSPAKACMGLALHLMAEDEKRSAV
ncbi:MAG: asparaginase [Limnohabitans sp.]|nr:asparaginase [Limnohabitans sp.]